MDFLPNFSVETWALLVVLVTVFFLYGSWTHEIFRKLGIPGPRPLPFIGTFHEYRKGMLEFDMKCFKKYGKMWGIFDGRTPILVVMDPVILKSILVKECYTHFTNRRPIGLNGPFEEGMSVAKDDEWKRIRTVLSPTFTSGRLKEMFPIMKSLGETLVKNVQKKTEHDEPLDMKQLFGSYSTDVVISTSFGVNVDSMNNPNDPFVTIARKMFNFRFINPLLTIIVLFPFLTPILKKLNDWLSPNDLVQFFTRAIKSLKEKRQKGNHERVDFLQLMVDSQTEDTSSSNGTHHGYKALTDSEIIAQSRVFILAGYETTSTTLSFLSYNLATHPDVQRKLQQEIDTLLPNKAPPTYEALLQMEYLEMAINEALRLYPAGGRIERVCKKTVEVKGVTIPEGVVVVIPLYSLHRDPEYWPEPDKFNPDRFTKENKETQEPYTFLPFGSGPRNCIAMRFALLNVKVGIVSLLQNFSFQVCKETPIPLELDTRGFVQPKTPIYLKLVPRTATRVR
ncbi:cytochrome P450 3A21-like isoform X2 [Pleurodeles waltl]|uniref:cytochrome P450 3A21-like isoform X2 n=1 Tax=Pleurodeles waltl TaxID=8319 RepID=UPI0037093A7A